MEIVIKNGRIIDGAGNPWFKADIGIQAGKIVKIGKIETADQIIEADDLVVCPGFIDPHNHTERSSLIDPRVESMVRQGVTTMLIGQCGGSVAPINPSRRDMIAESIFGSMPDEAVETVKLDWTTYREYLSRLEAVGCSSNLATLVGHATVRMAVLGFEDRSPSPNELGLMKLLVAEAMEAGAFGLSSGLFYPPGAYAKTEELVELCKIVARYGGIYDTHLRNEGDNWIDGIEEALEIGEKAGVPVQISHFKAGAKKYWGRSDEALKLLEEARAEGIDVTFDQYPYRAGQTGLAALLPYWARAGGPEMLAERLKNTKDRERIKRDIEEGIPGWQNILGDIGFENVLVIMLTKRDNKMLEGRTLDKVAEIKGKDHYTAYFDLLVEEEGRGSVAVFLMDEDDISTIMKHQLQMVGSDGWAVAPHGILGTGKPHPRFYGCYPRVLGRYVREMGILTFEEAVRKMTSFPAQRLGLYDRGLLKEGLCADIVIFDPEAVKDKGTYQDPHQFPEGIRYVLVNGEVVVEEGEHTGARPGKVLKKGSRAYTKTG